MPSDPLPLSPKRIGYGPWTKAAQELRDQLLREKRFGLACDIELAVGRMRGIEQEARTLACTEVLPVVEAAQAFVTAHDEQRHFKEDYEFPSDEFRALAAALSRLGERE